MKNGLGRNVNSPARPSPYGDFAGTLSKSAREIAQVILSMWRGFGEGTGDENHLNFVCYTNCNEVSSCVTSLTGIPTKNAPTSASMDSRSARQRPFFVTRINYQGSMKVTVRKKIAGLLSVLMAQAF